MEIQGLGIEMQGLNNATYSHTVGSVTTVPHPCEFCHKQYASKAKLMQHQRKKHPQHVQQMAPSDRRRSVATLAIHKTGNTTLLVATPMGEAPQTPVDNGEVNIATQPIGGADNIQAADLLTQAMSELQGMGDFRPQTEYRITTAPGGAAVLQPTTQHSTIELSHLGQTLVHTFQQQQIASAPQATLVAPQTLVAVSGAPGQATLSAVPVSLPTAYIPRAWTTAAPYPTLR